jgi:hypothetical protein
MQTVARSNSLSKTIDKVGALLTRNSTHRKRARRASALLPPPPFNGDVVIGVSVESATVEAGPDDDKSGYATVFAEGSNRPCRRASWFGMPRSDGKLALAIKASQIFRWRRNSETSL